MLFTALLSSTSTVDGLWVSSCVGNVMLAWLVGTDGESMRVERQKEVLLSPAASEAGSATLKQLQTHCGPSVIILPISSFQVLSN